MAARALSCSSKSASRVAWPACCCFCCSALCNEHGWREKDWVTLTLNKNACQHLSSSLYLCSVGVLQLQLSPQHPESLLQQGRHPQSQAFPVGLSVERLPQAAVETQNIPVPLLLPLVALLDLLPQQGQLALHTLQSLQVHTWDHHRGKRRLRKR